MNEVTRADSPKPRKKIWAPFLALGVLLLVVSVVMHPWSKEPKPSVSPLPPTPKPKLKEGSLAPDFELKTKDGKKIRLSAWSKKAPVALWFFAPT